GNQNVRGTTGPRRERRGKQVPRREVVRLNLFGQAGWESIYQIGPGEGNTSLHRLRTSTKFFAKLEYLREKK
ncbi:unnamed protein product, partial [Tenebrio molitor]